MRGDCASVYFVILRARRVDCNPPETTRHLTRQFPPDRLSHHRNGESVVPSNPRTNLLAETDWLAERLTEPSLRIVDIRGIIRPPDAPHPHYFGNRSAYL